jgi:hypothetical protein
MALTEGNVGYMLPMDAREVGDTVLAAWPVLGECCEPYERTLEAGVKAGVSVLCETTAVACDDGAWVVAAPGGELLERNPEAAVCT